MPLLFQPGSEWNYGVSTDVLGRLVEVVAGKPLDEVFAERVFAPLGMTETSFGLRPRTTSTASPSSTAPGVVPLPPPFDAGRAPQAARSSSGGGGLVSTAGDYLRFLEMLRAAATPSGDAGARRPDAGAHGAQPPARQRRPGDLGRPLFAESPLRGVGFGLGFSLVLDPARYGPVASVGDYSWGGAASTEFYVDPVEDLTVASTPSCCPRAPCRSAAPAPAGQPGARLSMEFLLPDERTLHGSWDPPARRCSPSNRGRRCGSGRWTRGGPPARTPARTPRPRRPAAAPAHDPAHGHALTGPVAVAGAEPGQVLAVRIDDVVPGAFGTTYAGCARPRSTSGSG